MQKKNRPDIHDKVHEIIIQNRQKGQMYRIMFENDPVCYEGIPIAPLTTADSDIFEMRVTGPRMEGEVLRRSVHDIVLIEAC